MKICVVGGGGAIGGFVAVRLANAGHDVTVVARGATLEAIRKNGLKLISEEHPEGETANVKIVERVIDAGIQDVIILAMKAHQVTPIAQFIPNIMGPETVVIPMQNGIPFWYFQRHGGEYADRAVETVDPSGTIMKTLDPNRIIGCVVYPAAVTVAPGVIKHVEGIRFPIGELDGTTTERAQRISEAFIGAGFKSPILENIRSEIWLKLWGNMTFNPISALTHGTLLEICQHPLTRQLAYDMMVEAQDVAHKLGITFRLGIEKRIEGAEKVGRHKTSMLQDVEAGRGLEVDALLGAVIELGEIVGVPTPRLKAVYALTALLGQSIDDAKAGLSLKRPGNQHSPTH
jgi:2-dehydropantoate 2-reductase